MNWRTFLNDTPFFTRMLSTVVLVFCMVCANTTQAALISIAMTEHQWPSHQRIEFCLVASGDPDSGPAAGLLPDHLVCSLENGARDVYRHCAEDDRSGGG